MKRRIEATATAINMLHLIYVIEQMNVCKILMAVNCHQWHRRDMLRGGAKIEIMSLRNHGGLQGRLQQLLDD